MCGSVSRRAICCCSKPRAASVSCRRFIEGTAMAQLLLDNVSKTYRPRGKEPVQAVKRVSLDVKDGEIVALLGSSGCGKTSMLRMIAGFEDVTERAIQIGRASGRERGE